MNTLRDMFLIARDVSQIGADLIKCQVEHLTLVYKETLTRLLAWSMMVLVAILFAMGGLALIVFSMYAYLTRFLSPGTAAVILGTALLLLAAIIFLLAKSKLKD